MFSQSPFSTENELSTYRQKANPPSFMDFTVYEEEFGRITASNYQPVSNLSVRIQTPTGLIKGDVFKSDIVFENPPAPKEIAFKNESIEILNEEETLLYKLMQFVEMSKDLIGEQESRAILHRLRVRPTLETIVEILKLLGIPIETLSESLRSIVSNYQPVSPVFDETRRAGDTPEVANRRLESPTASVSPVSPVSPVMETPQIQIPDSPPLPPIVMLDSPFLTPPMKTPEQAPEEEKAFSPEEKPKRKKPKNSSKNPLSSGLLKTLKHEQLIQYGKSKDYDKVYNTTIGPTAPSSKRYYSQLNRSELIELFADMEVEGL